MPTTPGTDFSDQESNPSIETIHLREKVAMLEVKHRELEAKAQALEARVKELEAMLTPPPDAASAATNFLRARRR